MKVAMRTLSRCHLSGPVCTYSDTQCVHRGELNKQLYVQREATKQFDRECSPLCEKVRYELNGAQKTIEDLKLVSDLQEQVVLNQFVFYTALATHVVAACDSFPGCVCRKRL